MNRLRKRLHYSLFTNLTRCVHVVLLLLCLQCNQTNGERSLHNVYKSREHLENPKMFNVGSVVDSAENTAQFLQVNNKHASLLHLIPKCCVKVVEEVNYEPNILPTEVTLYPTSIPLNPNPVRTVQNVCDKLIKSQVYVVIINDGDSPEALAVSQTCNFYNIPVIGLSNRDSSMSDKHMHSVYMRTVPPYSHQVDVWVILLKELDYRHVVFIHSANYDGRTTFIRFENLAEKENIIIRSIIEYEPGVTDIVNELEEADEEIQCRVYLLYTSDLDAQSIFIEVSRLNMTAPGYVWIVSEQALRATNVPDGVLALKLFNATNGVGHIRDSVYIVGMAIRDMYLNENITKPPSHCGDLSKNQWETGTKFFNYLRKQSLLYGKTGRVAFDGKGDRIDADYEIINMVHGRPVTVGQYAYSQIKMRMQLWLNAHSIIWPGYLSTKPIGYVIPTHLRVVTIEEKPFIWTKRLDDGEKCEEGSYYCPKFNKKTNSDMPYCCQGYCIDFLSELSRRLNFTYSLYQVEDDVYGSFEQRNGTDYPKIWTGLVGDLVYKKADMIVAPLTINPERSSFIDFSKPFKYQGITILEKRQPRRATLASFLEPFENSLWVLVSVAVHFVALALYLLDRFSPFGRYRLPNSEITEEDALNLSSAIWFAWGVLLNSGIGEGTPRSFSGRVLGMVWAGFAMIMVASYTANLAALLVLDRPKTSLIGINDPRIRNPLNDFSYATVKGSAVEMYFKSQVELQTMYKHMQKRNFMSVEDAVEALRQARLEFEAAHDCDLITAAEQFGRSGYGVGLQKNSFWLEKINHAILSMHESGFVTDLDNNWISVETEDGGGCGSEYERFPTTLGLRNMAGVFILVGAGIVGGIGLIVIEVVYKKQQTKSQRQLDAARGATYKWKDYVQKRKYYRSSLQKMRAEQIKQQLHQEQILEVQIQHQRPTSQQQTQYQTKPIQRQQQQQSLIDADIQHFKEQADTTIQMQPSFESPFTVEKGISDWKMEEERQPQHRATQQHIVQQYMQPMQAKHPPHFKHELEQKVKQKSSNKDQRKKSGQQTEVKERKRHSSSRPEQHYQNIAPQFTDSYSSLPTSRTPTIRPPHAMMYHTKSHEFNYGYTS
ncbi:hypothetical protein B4U80_08658 [Leptotrombidium deliense]|uniref:Glutamate [NMDA] receptor subunit 1 n=1 Tax=Leptotrombidium deliense TaxID=299467 RepID=A0A443ST76_9ACAR|nr:hypothetical protein B4U80_08658 [Leptotrombidium deliense]